MARRLGIPPGGMRAGEAARAAALVALVHVPVNLVGYAIGARTSPL